MYRRCLECLQSPVLVVLLDMVDMAATAVRWQCLVREVSMRIVVYRHSQPILATRTSLPNRPTTARKLHHQITEEQATGLSHTVSLSRLVTRRLNQPAFSPMIRMHTLLLTSKAMKCHTVNSSRDHTIRQAMVSQCRHRRAAMDRVVTSSKVDMDSRATANRAVRVDTNMVKADTEEGTRQRSRTSL